MTRTHSNPSRRFVSLASLESIARRRSRLAAGVGLVFGLALPPLFSAAAPHLPEAPALPTVSELRAQVPSHRTPAWKPAPPQLEFPAMIRENASERRRVDLEGMTRR